MKKTIFSAAFFIFSLCALAQDTIREDSIIFTNSEQTAGQRAAEILEQQQIVSTIYLCGMILAIFACLITIYIYRRRLRKYSEVINLQSRNLNAQKHQADNFGLMLNLALFPCCLVRANGEIIWCNDAFYNFYGQGRKEFSVSEGTSEEFDLNSLKNNKFGSTFFVKMKNVNGKVIGFKRTVIPIQNGEQGYAIIENTID